MVRQNMTNNDIYIIASDLVQNITQLNLHLPVKVNFYLQKNIDAILAIAQDLEKSRNEILERYGTKDEETGNYSFEDDNLEKANQELIDLFTLEQEVPIYKIKLEDFNNIELDSKQVQAISYMIEDIEE